MVWNTRFLFPLLAACSAPAPVRHPPPAAVPTASSSNAPAAPAPVPPAQMFAPADPGFAFADPDRGTKLMAAFPAIDTALADELKRQNLPGFAVGIVIDGKLEY